MFFIYLVSKFQILFTGNTGQSSTISPSRADVEEDDNINLASYSSNKVANPSGANKDKTTPNSQGYSSFLC